MLDARALDDPELTALRDRLLSLLSKRGLTGSEPFPDLPGWDAESYAYIGRLLIQARAVPDENKPRETYEEGECVLRDAASENIPGGLPRGERSLYAPIVETLGSAWALAHGIQDHVIDITASQGRRVTGGKWSRPDITLASSNEYRFVPGRSVEIRTFEVKTHEGVDITAVYEALSHRRAAHFAHVLVHVPEYDSDVAKQVLLRVIADAEAWGVGVTTFADPREYRTWRVEVAARRSNPDPAALNAFIYAQTGERFKDKIVSWCRRV